MAFGRRKPVEIFRGQATIRLSGREIAGTYELAGDAGQLRGRERLRLVFLTTPDEAEAVFRARDGRIAIDGRNFKFEALAHTVGDSRVWTDISLGG
ncbi:hypothetical protein ACO2Q0_20670 [Phenylobacterium sp. VNQ135]|uniref:hypothetical protein n=1 Tax=Phenylobacterium sp. VNQ135 TaxID=3400922 RepID=UPI003C1061C2